MKILLYIVFLVLFIDHFAVAQKVFQITAVRLGKVRIYELNENDPIHYKRKGDLFYHKDVITAMHDSTLLLSNDQVTFRDLKSVRVRKQQHLFHTFQTFFLGAGVGFFGLSAFNNALLKNPPIISERVTYISAGLLLTSFIIYELGVRHLHINKHKTLRIIDRDYSDLNTK